MGLRVMMQSVGGERDQLLRLCVRSRQRRDQQEDRHGSTCSEDDIKS